MMNEPLQVLDMRMVRKGNHAITKFLVEWANTFLRTMISLGKSKALLLAANVGYKNAEGLKVQLALPIKNTRTLGSGDLGEFSGGATPSPATMNGGRNPQKSWPTTGSGGVASVVVAARACGAREEREP
ncbi:hypothetical protein EPI10_027545 [Gossypium australe]|uniref:Uncharacterized protein n=1 Tax=Gossypium australe TaxID=47621 RepID=A0A5B6UWA1_9ROSI|nr:hypothetical protein EPI10_027545 [Gossypium australe]